MTAVDDTFQGRITVVIADDHSLSLEGFARAVRNHPDLELVAQARDGGSALAAIEEHMPDVALVDVRMPCLDGVELCGRLGASPTRVVLLTAHPTSDLRARALDAGAVNFLDKETPRQDLCEALVAAVRP